MKNYEELNEDLQDEARRWHPTSYEKWTYNVQDNNIRFCII